MLQKQTHKDHVTAEHFSIVENTLLMCSFLVLLTVLTLT